MKASSTPKPEIPEGDSPEGRAARISHLFRQHNRALLTFLFGFLKDNQAANEVAQEAYVKLLQLEQPGAIGFLHFYLFRVAKNLAIDRIRQEQNRAENAKNARFE